MKPNINLKKISSITLDSTAKIKNVVEPLWKILTFSPTDNPIAYKKNLSISLEKGILYIAYGSRFLSLFRIHGVRKYSFEDEKYPSPDAVASSTALAINDLRASGTDITLIIPKAWAVIKTADFPVTVKENILNVISYELDRLTPFNPEEAYYDFRILKESDTKLTVLIIAVSVDSIRPYIEALRDKDINVSSVTINLSSICAFCRSIYKITDFVFIEITENGYEGALYINGLLNSAFSSRFDTDDIELKSESIKSNIDKYLSTIKQNNKSPILVILTKDNNPALIEMIKLKLNVHIKILNEANIPFKFSSDHKEIPYSAIGAILESILPGSERLNILKKGYYETKKSPLMFTVILILVLIVMWVLYLIAPLRIEGKRLDEIDRQIEIRKEEVKKVESLKKELEDLRKELSIIDDFKKTKPMTLDILRELTIILPKSAWLTRVRISESNVNIEGYASSASALLPKLERSKFFKKAEFASPTFRDRRMNADRFNIKMELEQNIETKKD